MKKLISIAFVFLALMACKDKKSIDVQPPVIGSVLADGSAASSIVKQAGEILHLTVNVTDNSDLNQLQLILHQAQDGHTHSGNGDQGGQDRLNSGYWGYSEVVNLSGTSAQHEWDIQIPDSIAGHWHVMFALLDEVGLVATTYTLLVEVTNENIPVITGTTFPISDDSGTVHISAGNNLNISGQTADVDGLKRFFVYMQNANGVTGDTLDIPIIGDGHSMAFGPATFNQGNIGTFRVVIESMDSLGYHGKWDAKVIVQ